MKQFLFVIGSPRSGTTTVASKIAEILGVSLLPEAQWIIDLYKKRDQKTNKYIYDNWGDLDVKSFTNISKGISEVFVSYCESKGIQQNVFVEHTPQNVLCVQGLTKDFNESLFVIVLRNPKKSINSLSLQKWYRGGVFRAALYNLRMMLSILFLRRDENKVYIDIDEYMPDKLEGFLLSRGYPINNIVKYNYYLDYEGVRQSHEYMQDRSMVDKSGGAENIVINLLSFPSYLIYKFLRKTRKCIE